MFQNILFLILAYMALLFQVMMRESFLIGTVEPNLPVVILVLACLHSRPKMALIWAALIGLLVDTVSRGELGLTMFCALFCTGLMPARWFASKKTNLFRFAVRSLILCSLIIFSSTILRQTLSGNLPTGTRFYLETSGTCLYSMTLATVLKMTGQFLGRFIRPRHFRRIHEESAYI